MQVLVVEDDPASQRLLEEVLTRRGHSVKACANPSAAWKEYQRTLYPLVLLDWSYPGGTGAGLCRRIRASPQGALTEIVVVTALAAVDDMQAVLGSGADDYLSKPVDLYLLRIRLAIAEQHVRARAERAQTGELLRTREEELRQAQKMDALGRLAGGLAHDMNNILTGIMAYAELLQRQLEPGDKRRGHAEQVMKVADRGAAMIRQLLAFSRKQTILPRQLKLDTVLNDLAPLLRRLLGEDVVLEIQAGGPAPILAHPSQIEQILLNLSVNARDAMPEGGRLTIRTAEAELGTEFFSRHVSLRPGPYVQLTVTDTGCGMSEEILAHVFEPFYTTKPQGQGTGLGLSVVYGIVQQCGGLIEVQSRPGQGTRFDIYLPRLPATAVSPPIPARQDSPAKGGETILLVEDETEIRQALEQIIGEQGYTVLAAAHGHAALEAARRHAGPIHLLVTDIVMPQIDGRRLAAELRRQRPETRILYMSGFSATTLVRYGLSGDYPEILLKPFRPEVLLERIRKVLDAPRRTNVPAERNGTGTADGRR